MPYEYLYVYIYVYAFNKQTDNAYPPPFWFKNGGVCIRMASQSEPSIKHKYKSVKDKQIVRMYQRKTLYYTIVIHTAATYIYTYIDLYIQIVIWHLQTNSTQSIYIYIFDKICGYVIMCVEVAEGWGRVVGLCTHTMTFRIPNILNNNSNYNVLNKALT